MPLLTDIECPPHPFFASKHWQTIIPSLFRKVKVRFERERLELADGDFLDLDWSRQKSKSLAILTHGLEGSTRSQYINGMTRALNLHGWDTLAWNFRNCSEEPNRLLQSYHSGASHDLHTVVEHALSMRQYSRIVLAGFSLGGNITLKYVGEKGAKIDKRIEKALAFSAPIDLRSCADTLAQKENWIYLRSFMTSLKRKIKQKAKAFPNLVDLTGLRLMKTFKEFDDRFTGPIHGFKDALDYWAKCSSIFLLNKIRIPTLLINAKNDPFLSQECYPYEIAKKSNFFYFLAPRLGGHCGFQFRHPAKYSWSEIQAIRFFGVVEEGNLDKEIPV